jgi:hypothetical protein
MILRKNLLQESMMIKILSRKIRMRRRRRRFKNASKNTKFY